MGLNLPWRWSPALAIFAFAVFLSCWKTGLMAVPDWSDGLERLRLEQIDTIDRQTCEKFGFPFETPQHADCRRDLLGVRAHDRGMTSY